MVTYLDRLLAFTVPLFVLKGLNNDIAYTAVEYIISLSVMIATFCDLGIRNYVLYHFRQSGDKVETTNLVLAGYFCTVVFQLAAIGGAALFFWGYGSLAPSVAEALLLAAMLRASALSTTTLVYQLLVLHDRPALASLPSLVQWLLVLVVMLLWPTQYSGTLGLAIAVPCLPIMIAGLWLSTRAMLKVGPLVGARQIIAALRWGWPLLASAALSMGIVNLSRIYGFNHLAHPEQVALNFWLRVFSIVQLAHATAMTTSFLEIYQNRKAGLLLENAKRYMQAIGGAFGLVAGLFVASLVWWDMTPAIGLFAFVGIGAYTMAWCLTAYFEIYLTRDGKARSILNISVITTIVYGLLLISIKPNSINYLILIMAISTIFSFLMMAKEVIFNNS